MLFTNRHVTVAFKYSVAVLLSVHIALASTAMADNTRQQKRITFYNTYGYLLDNHWHIPYRLWVNEAPGRIRQLSARAGRKMLRKSVGIEKLTDAQEQRFLYRVDGIIADSKSGKQVSLLFDNDPRKQRFQLSNNDGIDKTDYNGLLEGNLVLPASRAVEILCLLYTSPSPRDS